MRAYAMFIGTLAAAATVVVLPATVASAAPADVCGFTSCHHVHHHYRGPESHNADTHYWDEPSIYNAPPGEPYGPAAFCRYNQWECR